MRLELLTILSVRLGVALPHGTADHAHAMAAIRAALPAPK